MTDGKDGRFPQINQDSLPPVGNTSNVSQVDSPPEEPLPEASLPTDPPPPIPQNPTSALFQSPQAPQEEPALPASPSQFPPIPSAGVSVNQPPVPPPGESPSRLGFLKSKLVLAFVLLVLVIGLGAGGVFYYLNQRVTSYTLLPDDTQFYLGLSVKKHPQVQKLLDLSKKLPGGEKMIKYLDDWRGEIFGTQKDPFKEILNLAEEEIFLAKISPEDSSVGGNALEQLVNIVALKDAKEAKEKLANLEDDANITTTKEAYGSAKIAKFELKSQKMDESAQRFSTGPIPYQVTLPLSKSIFSVNLNEFLVAAERESDVKKIIDLATNAKEKKLKSIEEDEEHNEITSHFPKEYLLKFYQRQVLDPFSNIMPATTLPQNFWFGQSYDTRERNSQGDNVFTTKRGLTIVAQDNGVDFTSYQLTKKSEISEKIENMLKHGFSMESSLANKLPATFDGKSPLFYGEAKNIRDSIQDQLNQLEDVSKNSSDEQQKKAFEDAKKGIEEFKKQIKEAFQIDVDADLLSWMDQNAAMIVAADSQKAPEILFVFEIKDPQLVEQKLVKFRMVDFMGTRLKQAQDASMKNDVGQIATALQAYYTTPGQGLYPTSLNDLVSSEYLKTLPKPASGGNYNYLRCDNGTEAAIFAKSEETGRYWAFSSKLGRAGYIDGTNPPVDCNFNVLKQTPETLFDKPRIEPEIEPYQTSKIYSFPIYDYEGDKFAFRFTVTDSLTIFSVGASSQSLKELIDFPKESDSTLIKDPRWSEQFARSPKTIGGVAYIVPENLMGIVDYFLTKEEQYKQYVQDDWLIIARGYLKALKSIGTTTTQEGKTLISNTFINIEQLPTDEAKQVEEALDRVFAKNGDVGQRTIQARDSVVKSGVGQIAQALQVYYTTPGNSKYPVSLNELVTSKTVIEVPTSPSGETYGYLWCADGKEVAVSGKLESTGTYWVWSSASMKAIDTNSTTPPSTTCVYGL
ncbi:hypothetical protein A2495_00570 [Candidatus Curtissbacteria bacterium RIFOXYC12_FULL_41_11]|nr:MAG: hypothetical protein A2495_00570 [Candidatus Curtissbacteria bacterium RIFOXYC12_FULL_41_11]